MGAEEYVRQNSPPDGFSWQAEQGRYAPNYVHERRVIQMKGKGDARLRCVVCCTRCDGEGGDDHHSRLGHKVATQCSKCLVPLCDDKVRVNGVDVPCWVVFHSHAASDLAACAPGWEEAEKWGSGHSQIAGELGQKGAEEDQSAHACDPGPGQS